MKNARYLLSFFMLIFSPPLLAAEKMQIAVIDLIPQSTSKMMSAAATDILRSEMVKTGMFIIVERSQMDSILREQGFQQTGCTDNACAVQMGRLLSAKKILVGEINKIGRTFILTVRIVDVEKGSSDFSQNEKARDQEDIDKACKRLTDKLVKNIVEGNKEYFVARRVPAGYYLRGIVPGWAQIYGGSPKKGYTIMGAFAAAAGYLAYSVIDMNKKKSEYEDLGKGTPQSAIDSKYKAAEDATLFANIAFWTTAGIYLLNWADLLFITEYAPEGEGTQAAAVTPYFYKFDIAFDCGKTRNTKAELGFGMRF